MESKDKRKEFLETLSKSLDWKGIRKDLLLHPGQRDSKGNVYYILEDPIDGSHYQIGEEEGLFLRCIAETNDIKQAVQNYFNRSKSASDINEVVKLIKTFEKLGLTEKKISEKKKTKSIFQNAIYFRIPILKPDIFLDSTLEYVRWLGSMPVRLLFLGLSLYGLFSALPKYEIYLSTYSHLFSPLGGLCFLLFIVLIKIGHEFAHAYVTKALGYSVRSIGVAFVIFWPILYTDTTESWKSSNRNERILISSAGIIFEFFIAGISLFIWNYTSEGIFQSLLFYASSTSLLISLFVNANPLMKFDGYYILMDWLEIPNLQSRSLLMVRYYILKYLLHWQEQCPESERKAVFLCYGIGATFYRFFVLFSISLMIYTFFFPLLGLMLMCISCVYFFIVPLLKNIKFVITNKNLIGKAQCFIPVQLLFVSFFVLMFIPYASNEKWPGVLVYSGISEVHSTGEGETTSNIPQLYQEVKKGDVLFVINNPELKQDIEINKLNIFQNEERYKYLSTGGAEGAYRKLLMTENKRLQAVKEKSEVELEQLIVRAPISGQIVKISEVLRKGQVLQLDQYLLTIKSKDDIQVKSYISEKKYDKDEVLDQSVFLATKGFPSKEFQLIFEEVNPIPIKRIQYHSLYDYSGGALVSQNLGEHIQTRESQIEVVYSLPTQSLEIFHGEDVWVYRQSRPKSVAEKVAKPFMVILNKEGWL